MKLLIFAVSLFISYCTSAQIAGSGHVPQAILQHYSLQELQTIQQTDSVKYNTIFYYYTQSFIFESVPCNCQQVSPEEFDISQYEYMRKRKVRFTRHFEKYGFKVTFLAVDELKYKLPIHIIN